MSIRKKKNEPVVMTVNSSSANEEDLRYISGEAFKALSEMARIYSSVKDGNVKTKINELMRITDKIDEIAKANAD